MAEYEIEKDSVDKIIDLCRKIKDDNVKRLVLGLDGNITDIDNELNMLESKLRRNIMHREKMFNRIVNLVFAYIIAKYSTLDLKPTSNCEARIKHVIDHIYSSYNVTDDVVKYVILNVALGLDASEAFRNKFNALSENDNIYKNTNEYINIFKHMQKLKQSPFKTRNRITGTVDWLYKMFDKLEFICKLELIDGKDYIDPESGIKSCSFKIDGHIYPSKYILVKYAYAEKCEKFLFLRCIDELRFNTLRLSYTELSETDVSEDIRVFVTSKENPPSVERERVIKASSTGKFYSYITGDLLRKRHRMSFCNGLSSYKYYGELAASVMDALEMLVSSGDKQFYVLEHYILPVVKNNFNICQDDCVCTGVGCKYGARERKCGIDKTIELKDKLTANCLINMDTVSILTILFSVVGCKEILPQIFAQFPFADGSDYDNLFSKVNDQLDKRFSEFNAQRVETLRQQFYKKSLDYLSLDLDEIKGDNKIVSQTLKPFKIKAYTDALIVCLENLDRDKADCTVNPNENVYSIQSKIDLISSMNNVGDARNALRDTLKIILTYYSGLANCTQEQLSYEIQAEQNATLNNKVVRECRESINNAFMDGVDKKLKALGKDPNFYTLFKMLFNDNNELKADISIMLGRNIVNVNVLSKIVEMDDNTCNLVSRRRKENGMVEVIKWDLDNEDKCRNCPEEFIGCVARLLNFFKGDDIGGARFACYPQVLTHTSSKVNVDNTTINSFTVYESERYTPQKEYNVITYFNYEISKHYYYVAPKKFEKTRWITYPILIRCSDFYNKVIKDGFYE